MNISLRQMPMPRLSGTLASRIKLLSDKAVAVHEIEEAVRKLEGALNKHLEAEPEADNGANIILNNRVITARISALSLLVSTLSEGEIAQTRTPPTPEAMSTVVSPPTLDILAETDTWEERSSPAAGTRAFVPLSDAVNALAFALSACVQNLSENSEVPGIDTNKTNRWPKGIQASLSSPQLTRTPGLAHSIQATQHNEAGSDHRGRDFGVTNGKRSQSPRPRMVPLEAGSLVSRPTSSNASATTISGPTGVTDLDSTFPLTFPTSHIRTSANMQVDGFQQSLVSGSPFSSQSVSLAPTHAGYGNTGMTTWPYVCNTLSPYLSSSNLSFIPGPLPASTAIPPKVGIFDRSAGSSSANSDPVNTEEHLAQSLHSFRKGEQKTVPSSKDILASIKVPQTVPPSAVSATSKGRASRTRASISSPLALDNPKGKGRVSATKKNLPRNEPNDGGKETSPRRSSRLNSSNTLYAGPN